MTSRMDIKMKRLVGIMLLLGSLVAYGNPLTIGVIKVAPPFSSAIGNSNHYFGFCIDLMDELCLRMNIPCQYKATEVDKQLNDLREGFIDVTFLISPISPTDTNDYLYSLPYIPSSGQFLTLNNSEIHAVKDLKNKKIGVMQASALKKTVLIHYTSLDNIHEYENVTDLILALTTHKVDAILMNSSVAKYIINNTLDNLRIVGSPVQLGMGYGIIALKRNAEIINRINKALLQIEADGTYVSIYNKYFGN